jgi:hypothetical protein
MNAPVKFVGYPDGPKVFVAELGTEVSTFTVPPGGKFPALKHHVPLNKRGPFRPEDLANFDPKREYRTNAVGFLLCYAKTKADEKCKRKAINRFPRCNFHGGSLHPLDHIVQELPDSETEDEATLSRYQQFLAKQITVDDLDDEELLAFGFRTASGRIFKPRNVPRELVQQFTKAIFDRSLDKLKSSALAAAETLTSIMLDDSVDANIRVKAATEVLDRTLGKAPQLVAFTGNAPWEEIFEGITTATREESRRARQTPLDVDVIGEIEGPQPD